MDIAFEKLIKLQRTDSEISRLTLLLEAVPARLDAVEQQIQAASAIVTQAKDKLAANQKRRREMEGEVKLQRETVAKYKRQRNEIKSNKEYSALNKEIEEAEAKVDGMEEAILNEMIAADEIEKEIKAAQAKQASEEVRLRREKDTVAAEKADLEKQKAAVEAERQALLPSIPPEQQKLYLKISKKMGGVALSAVTDDFCSICQMRIRPQLLDELLGRKAIVVCEACGRILYWTKGGAAGVGPEDKLDDPDRVDDSAG